MKTEKSGVSLQQVILALFVLVVFFQAGTQTASAQERRAIKLPGTANLPFSDGVIAGDTLYVAGQEAIDENGRLAPGGIGAESKATLARIEKIVKEAGFDLKDIVSVTVYLADIHDFPEMNVAYKAVMPDPKPARATVQVAALVNNARVEISAIAVKRK
jgi:2-iminobutanoate/2-iminopropanoate deaminase